MPDVLSQENRPQLQKLRRFLRSEAKVLSEELDRLSTEGKERLKLINKKLEAASDRTLLTDAAAWKEELADLRRGVSRFALSGRHPQKLKNEWNDWERHASFTDPAEHETKRERQEMILSELRVRGLRVPQEIADRKAQSAKLNNETSTLEVAAPAPPPPCFPPPQNEEGVGGGGDAEDEPRETCLPYWEQLIAGLDAENMDPEQLTRLFKAFRATHGEQKNLDRQKGERRFRLTAFESW